MRIIARIAFYWLGLSAGVAIAIGRVLGVIPDDDPPLPQADAFGSDLDWLDDMPAECLSDAEVSARFDAIVATLEMAW